MAVSMTMGWKIPGGNSNSPQNSGNMSAFMSQVQSCCLLPVRTRCLELETIIKRSSSKDLHAVFPMLLDHIFGLNGQPGWDLHTLTSQYARDEFKYLQDFMSPNGPLFLMIYKLQSDHYLRYEFPVDKLPAPTRESLAAGIVPPFYDHNSLTYQPHGRAPSAVMLNAFTFYMYNFAYFLVSGRVHRTMNSWSQPQDCFYPVLLDQYLCYFLRSDGRSIPPIPVTSTTPSPAANRMSPYRLPQYGVLYHYLHTGTDSPRNQHHQHHDSSFSMHQHHSAGNTDGSMLGISFQQSLQDDARGETRSEVFIQAIAEFWLNQNSLRVSGEKGLISQVKENFIPSQDHVRVVRILIKRIHFFVNSAKPSQHLSPYHQSRDSALENLKRCLLPVFVHKPLYAFLRHGFDNWPLDSSFRQILEMWLSYIQPWRYVEEPSRTGMFNREIPTPLVRGSFHPKESKSFPVDDERWCRFVCENLPFYTVLFQELLPRIFHQDLSIPNNALMVYRVAKVFGQPHLSDVLKEAEQHLLDLLGQSQVYSGLGSNPSFMSPPPPSSSSSPPLPHNTHSPPTARSYAHLFEVEANGFVYRPLFGANGRAMIEQLLVLAAQAQLTVKTIAGPTLGDITQGISSWFMGSSKHSGHGVLFDDIGPVDARKAEAYLQNAAQFLSDVFEVPVPNPEDTANWNVGRIRQDIHLPPDTMDGQLTPLGRYQLMNRLRSSDVHYHGDPDLQPIRSYENATLVRALHSVSCQFNDAFGDKIIETCEQGGLLAAMARWYFRPTYVKPTHMPDHVQRPPTCIQPRLSLRFLANYRTMLFLSLLYLVLWYWYEMTPTGFVILLVIGVIFVGFAGACYRYLAARMEASETMSNHHDD